MHAEVGIDDGVMMIGGGATEFHAQGRISLFCTTAAVSQHEEMSDDTIKTLAISSLWAIRHQSGAPEPTAMSANGTSRHFAAPQDSVAIGA